MRVALGSKAGAEFTAPAALSGDGAAERPASPPPPCICGKLDTRFLDAAGKRRNPTHPVVARASPARFLPFATDRVGQCAEFQTRATRLLIHTTVRLCDRHVPPSRLCAHKGRARAGEARRHRAKPSGAPASPTGSKKRCVQCGLWQGGGGPAGLPAAGPPSTQPQAAMDVPASTPTACRRFRPPP